MKPRINFPIAFPKIVTNRLHLVPPNLNDAAELFELRSNPTFMKYMGRFPMQKLAEAEEYIQRILDGFEDKTGISWKICEKDSETLVGYIGFWSIDYDNFRTEFGYGIHPYFQQKGIATEALKAVVKYCFEELGIHSIEAGADKENIATIKLLEKCGFRKEAHFKENMYFNGTFLDSAIYCIVKQ